MLFTKGCANKRINFNFNFLKNLIASVHHVVLFQELFSPLFPEGDEYTLKYESRKIKQYQRLNYWKKSFKVELYSEKHKI